MNKINWNKVEEEMCKNESLLETHSYPYCDIGLTFIVIQDLIEKQLKEQK